MGPQDSLERLDSMVLKDFQESKDSKVTSNLVLVTVKLQSTSCDIVPSIRVSHL